MGMSTTLDGGRILAVQDGLPRCQLEVIALTVVDGLAAERGGADRLEVVATMDADGLLPDTEVVRRMLDSVTIPLRVMLRSRRGFGTDPKELEALCEAARRLKDAGVDQFVFGFLTEEGELDCPAMLALCAAATPRAWTLHRAFDQAVDAERAFDACKRLPGLDLILSSGGTVSLESGRSALCARADWQTAGLRWLAGGGLRLADIPVLRGFGVTQFHSGRAVRMGGHWDAPIDEHNVRQLKEALT